MRAKTTLVVSSANWRAQGSSHTMYGMDGRVHFEWDPAKDEANTKKHNVSFREASSVFLDENALLIDDIEHSDEEDRFILLGLSSSLRTLVVCHAYRTSGLTIRIISARKANSRERETYIWRLAP